MKVLHVISDRNIGGAGVLLLTLLKHFDGERVESEVALPRGSMLVSRIKELGIRTWLLEHDCDRVSLQSVRELARVIRQSRAELVHTNAALGARIAGRACHRGIVHTRHCCYALNGIWHFAPTRWMGGVLNRALSDLAIATADAAAENLLEMGIPQDRIRCILNGSDPVREVSCEELDRHRALFGIREGDFTVGLCARLEKCKGQEVLLHAAKLLTQEYPRIPFCFLIVGSGSDETRLKELARALGIWECVRFTGFVEDMAPIYRLLRLNVNCSVGTETSCLALSEGMSASLPMVVSDYGGNRAMIGGSGAGLLVPFGNAPALAEAIACIALDPLLEASMRKSALDRYHQKYTADQMTEHLTAVYESLYRCNR